MCATYPRLSHRRTSVLPRTRGRVGKAHASLPEMHATEEPMPPRHSSRCPLPCMRHDRCARHPRLPSTSSSLTRTRQSRSPTMSSSCPTPLSSPLRPRAGTAQGLRREIGREGLAVWDAGEEGRVRHNMVLLGTIGSLLATPAHVPPHTRTLFFARPCTIVVDNTLWYSRVLRSPGDPSDACTKVPSSSLAFSLCPARTSSRALSCGSRCVCVKS